MHADLFTTLKCLASGKKVETTIVLYCGLETSLLELLLFCSLSIPLHNVAHYNWDITIDYYHNDLLGKPTVEVCMILWKGNYTCHE